MKSEKFGSQLRLPTIVHLLQVHVDLSKKPKSKQFMYIHLKDLIKLFQKMVCFIGV